MHSGDRAPISALDGSGHWSVVGCQINGLVFWNGIHIIKWHAPRTKCCRPLPLLLVSLVCTFPSFAPTAALPFVSNMRPTTFLFALLAAVVAASPRRQHRHWGHPHGEHPHRQHHHHHPEGVCTTTVGQSGKTITSCVPLKSKRSRSLRFFTLKSAAQNANYHPNHYYRHRNRVDCYDHNLYESARHHELRHPSDPRPQAR